LICITFQWSGSLDDLKATIQHTLPNSSRKLSKLIPNSGKLIALGRRIKDTSGTKEKMDVHWMQILVQLMENYVK